MSDKGKTMKGVKTMHGKGITGVGLCKGGLAPHNKKRPQVLCFTKDGALFVPGEDFPFRDWLLNNTGAGFSHLASLPQLVSHCQSLVSPLYQSGAILEREKGQGEELMR